MAAWWEGGKTVGTSSRAQRGTFSAVIEDRDRRSLASLGMRYLPSYRPTVLPRPEPAERTRREQSVDQSVEHFLPRHRPRFAHPDRRRNLAGGVGQEPGGPDDPEDPEVVGAGLVVIEAENGRQALEIFALGGEAPKLVLTDVIMPELNGRELMDALADLSPQMPILFMSGYTGDEVLARSLLPETAPFIQKPFAPDELLQRVRGMLAGTSTSEVR